MPPLVISPAPRLTSRRLERRRAVVGEERLGPRELPREDRRVGRRQVADPLAADVGCRPAFERSLRLQERHRARLRVEVLALRGDRANRVGQIATPQDLQERLAWVVARPDHDDLERLVERPVERTKQRWHRLDARRERAQDLQGTLAELLVSSELCEAQQVERGDRIAGRNHAVVGGLLAREQALLALRREEVAASGIAEARIERALQRDRFRQPARLGGRLVEIDEALRERRVVVEEAVLLRLAVLPTALELLASLDVGQQELSCTHSML